MSDLADHPLLRILPSEPSPYLVGERVQITAPAWGLIRPETTYIGRVTEVDADGRIKIHTTEISFDPRYVDVKLAPSRSIKPERWSETS